MGYRRLNEQEWGLIWACFPEQHMGRPRKWNDRECLDAVLYLLHSGGRWEDLPGEFPPRTTVHDRFTLWVKMGILTKIFKRLRRRMPLGQVFHLDSTVKSAKKGQTRRKSGEGERQQNQSRNGRNRVTG